MTTKFEWTDDYRIDGGIIDAQHKRLLQLADQACSLSGRSDEFLEIEKLVNQLYEYIGFHFHREEKLMKEACFPAYEQHARAHASIIRRLNELLKSCTNLEQFVSKLSDAVEKWVLGHVMGKDKKFAAYISSRHSAKGVGPVAQDLAVQ